MDELLPEALPPGTLLGAWEIEGRAGYGTYGAVYRAHRQGQTEGPPVALKLARHPNDLRFDREAELLTRIQHPGVPRLLGRGTWTGVPRGETHPYLVMQWVDGFGLYEWARKQPLTPCRMLRLLAQVARALAATHAAQGLHRDVKGDNILVTPSGQAFLLDFGCGTWEGAASLTDWILAPGTRHYRSPQALRFHWNHRKASAARYRATPADDVYALGVTAYHLSTGVYPPLATDPAIAGDDGRDTLEILVPPGRLAPLVPELEALILRMLSDNPQDRGSAAELATAMEAAAATFGAETEASERWAPPKKPMSQGRPVVPFGDRRPPVPEPHPGEVWPWAVLPIAIGLLVLLSGNWNMARVWPPPSTFQDGGTGGVADAAVEELPVSITPQEPKPSRLSLDMPKEPLPGQRRPPCPDSQISIRGGCWVELRATPPCGEGAYAWKDACYYPVSSSQRPSTSDKP
ncbi:serine/threonine-protein kinase [Stigmatella sp. ncwal1]|uniref:Serine/threonine-protein kinase n=1 Tax=Stigmatella ashevillensis TaxID=2995309 RepID=A0ABT5D7S0_9BACT|nr:serine/threonine-protein kinase [Stigmatella ashevillena]MDC0709611.1 serine/threonine-protein kinase [Stigmatella ashevillena]